MALLPEGRGKKSVSLKKGKGATSRSSPCLSSSTPPVVGGWGKDRRHYGVVEKRRGG